MRNLYLFLILVIILIAGFIAFAFLFFEKEKHRGFIYAVEIGGKKAGYVEADRYKTEYKIIYKSACFYPKKPDCKIIHEKLFFDKRDFRLEKFNKECENFGATTETLYIKTNKGGTFDFLATGGSKSSVLSNMAHFKNISVFDAASIVTYMPFVDRYVFSMGGAQSFNAVYYSSGLLPPANGRVIFISVRDEYINVLGKKIKTECLVVRGRGLPETYIWVSKKDRDIVRLENKSGALLIKMVSFPEKLTVQDEGADDNTYEWSDIIFPSENIALAGTISVPRKEGKLPSVLLVTGEGPYDRGNAGLYASISQELAQAGYTVLSFDKRGMGESQGDNSEASVSTEIKDIESAVRFLANHEKADKDKIFIIANADACSYLPLLDFSKLPTVRGLVMLGITKPSPLVDFECEYVINKMNAMAEIDKKYPQNVAALKEQTVNLVKDAKKEYAFVQGRRVFLQRMNQILALNPLEDFKKLDIPSIIIYGKKDPFISVDYIKDVAKTIKEAKPNQFFQLHCFKDLGRFLGDFTDEANKVNYYKTNKEALEMIRKWIEQIANLNTADELTNT